MVGCCPSDVQLVRQVEKEEALTRCLESSIFIFMTRVSFFRSLGAKQEIMELIVVVIALYSPQSIRSGVRGCNRREGSDEKVKTE